MHDISAHLLFHTGETTNLSWIVTVLQIGPDDVTQLT